MHTPAQLARLPKWAQSYISILERRVTTLNAEVDTHGWQAEEPEAELFLRRSTQRKGGSMYEYLPLDKWTQCCHSNGVHMAAVRDHSPAKVRHYAEIRVERGFLHLIPRSTNVARATLEVS